MLRTAKLFMELESCWGRCRAVGDAAELSMEAAELLGTLLSCPWRLQNVQGRCRDIRDAAVLLRSADVPLRNDVEPLRNASEMSRRC